MGRKALGVGKTPVWTGAPASLLLTPGGSHNFGQYASDPQGDLLKYSLVSPIPVGYSIGKYTGVVTVALGAIDANITIRASDKQFYADHTCSIYFQAQVNTPPYWTDELPSPVYLSPYAGQPFTATFEVADDDGDPIPFVYDPPPSQITITEYAQVGNTRQLAISSDGTGLIAGDTYTIVVDLADASATTTAEQDWLARSTASGVVWAHDFRSEAEVSAFIDVTSGSTVSHSAAGITGGSLVMSIPSNPAAQTVVSVTGLTQYTARVVVSGDLGLTTSDRARFFGLPAPWDGLNDGYNGGSGLIQSYSVIAVNSATSFDISTVGNPGWWADVDTTGRAAYTGGSSANAQRCRVGRGAWHRPFSAIPATRNGKTSDDRGISAAELLMPARLWDYQSASPANRNYNYRKDYYCHPDYAALISGWKDGGGNSQTDIVRGTDFWVQVRFKIDSSRYQLAGVTPRNPLGLKMFAIWNLAETPVHEVVVMDNNIANDAPYTEAIPFDFYTGAGSAKSFSKGSALQPLGDWPNCRYNPWSPVQDCFHITADEWITMLVHVIPGKHQGWTGWPNPADGSISTGIQIWVAKQSRIDAARAAGQTATYQCLMDCTGVNGYPFFYENATGPTTLPVAPGYNSLWLTTYQNNIPVTHGWDRHYAQVIFKKGNGGNNPTTDGIPCPQV